MKLAKYLKKSGIPIPEFARKIGVSTATVYNILTERADIRLSTALNIEKTTQGQVKPQEILSEELLESSHDDLLVQTKSQSSSQKNKEKK